MGHPLTVDYVEADDIGAEIGVLPKHMKMSNVNRANAALVDSRLDVCVRVRACVRACVFMYMDACAYEVVCVRVCVFPRMWVHVYTGVMHTHVLHYVTYIGCVSRAITGHYRHLLLSEKYNCV